MGQAKQRGSFEQRKAVAIERDAEQAAQRRARLKAQPPRERPEKASHFITLGSALAHLDITYSKKDLY